MNTSSVTRGPSDGDIYARIIEALRSTGYIILPEVFSLEQLQALFLDIKNTDSGEFHPAGIGRGDGPQLNRFVRGDRIHWLERGHPQAGFFLDWAEGLRLCVNRELFLGLFDYECHYAHYPKGAFYKKHFDNFRGSTNRRLTTILYLNPNWQPHDGGELLIYDQEGQNLIETVMPSFGKMVVFLSEEFPHEVRPAMRSRYSLTGWFRVNNNTGINLDPPA